MASKIDYLTLRSGARYAEEGIFDYNMLITSIQDWYNSWKYTHRFKEHTFKEKDRGREVKAKLTGYREVDDDVKFFVDIEIFITDMQDVKIKNKKVQKGILDLKIFAYMQYDYKNKWRGYIKNFLFHIYKTHIIKDKIRFYYLDKLGDEVFDLRKEIKTALDFYK